MIYLKDVPWMNIRKVLTPNNNILCTELYRVYVQLVRLHHYGGLYQVLPLHLLHLLLPRVQGQGGRHPVNTILDIQAENSVQRSQKEL